MLLSPKVTCKQASSLCYVGSMNVELEEQKYNKDLREVNKDKRELRLLGSNRPILLTVYVVRIFCFGQRSVHFCGFTYKINFKRWTGFYYSDSDYMLLYLINRDLV